MQHGGAGIIAGLIFAVIFFAFCFGKLSSAQKLVVLGTAVAFLGILVAFAGTYWWNGSSRAWGPRHHLVPVELICLVAFAFALRELGRFKPWLRTLVALNIVLAVMVQGLALPMSPIIESRQLLLGDPVKVLPLMRARNLYHMARGDFDRPSLTHDDPIIADAARDHVDRILAFRLADYLSPRMSELARATWLLAALMLASVAGIILFAGALEEAPTVPDLSFRELET